MKMKIILRGWRPKIILRIWKKDGITYMRYADLFSGIEEVEQVE